MYFFYIIKSLKTSRLYKGHTADLIKRLSMHNAGKTKSTRSGIPWKLLYSEQTKTREAAIALEKFYKSFKGSKRLKEIIKNS